MTKTYNIPTIKNLITEAIAVSGKHNPENKEIHFLITEDLTIKDFSIEANSFSTEEGTVISVEPYSEGDILCDIVSSFIEYFNKTSDVHMDVMFWYEITNIVSVYSKEFNEKIADITKFFEVLATGYHSYGIYVIFNKKEFKAIDIVKTKKHYTIIDENTVPIYINSSKCNYLIDVAKECKEAIESALNINFKCDFQFTFEIFTESSERDRTNTTSDQNLIDAYRKNINETSVYDLVLSVIDAAKKHNLFGKEVHFRISQNLTVLSASLNVDEVASYEGLVLPLKPKSVRFWEDITNQIINVLNGIFDLNLRYVHWYEENDKTYVKNKFNSSDSYRFKIIDFGNLPKDAKAICFIDSDFTSRTRNLILNMKGK